MDYIRALFPLSLSGTIFISILLISKSFTGKQFNHQWQYYIWLIVVLRLLIPVTGGWNIMDSLWMQLKELPQHPEVTGQTAVSETKTEEEKKTVESYGLIINKTETGRDQVPQYKEISPSSISIWNHTWGDGDKTTVSALYDKISLFFFSVGMAGFLLKLFLSLLYEHRILKESRLLESEEYQYEFDLIKTQMKVNRKIRLTANRCIRSPMILGIIRPCIVLTDKEIGLQDFKYVVMHELIHFKRKDYLYKLAVQLSLCIHWFNPFVWLMQREINRECEISCDEGVLGRVYNEERFLYGDMLLHSVHVNKGYKKSIITSGLGTGGSRVRERLVCIMNYKKISFIKKAIGGTIAALICLTIFLTGYIRTGIDIYAKDKVETSYLTGFPANQAENIIRPLAVMLDNSNKDSSYAGLSNASIIYEAPIEGNVTRFMGIFENYGEMVKIGYIRSSRDYFISLAKEYHAVFAHYGQTFYELDLINQGEIDHISGRVDKIQSPAKYSFLTDNDKKAPYNKYVEGEGVIKDIADFRYDMDYQDKTGQKFYFLSSGEQVSSKAVSHDTYIYPGNSSGGNAYQQQEACFRYKDGKYIRYQYGSPIKDENTGKEIEVSNVIYQYCTDAVRDEKGYQTFQTIGEENNRVIIFTQGKMTEGTWSRPSETEPAIYKDENGDYIKITPGKTWICVIGTKE